MRAERLPALDGLRGLAILAVFFYHIAFFGGASAASPVDRALLGFALHGWLGVDLFFVLSGFLITGILLDTREEPGAPRAFYLRRIRRIVPAYAVALLSQAMVFALRGEFGSVRLGWSLTWTTNFLIAGEGWSGLPATMQHYWSLAVEEQFYLLWPLLVLWLDRRTVRWVALGAVVGASLCRVVLAQRGLAVAAYVLLPSRMDGLAVGALLALAVRDPGGIRAAQGRWTRAGIIAGVILLLRLLARGSLAFGDPVMLAVGLGAAVVVMGAVLVRVAAPRRPARMQRWLERGPLAWLAPYSYALYLWHQPVIVCLTGLGLTARALPTVYGSELPGLLALTVVAGAITLALAMASWHWLEAPLLRPRTASTSP